MDLNSLTSTLTPAAVMLIPLVAGIVQMIKWLPVVVKYKDYLPFASLGLGILLAYINHIANPIMIGIIVGLAATGSYETIKD